MDINLYVNRIYNRSRFGTIYRVKEIFLEAPWSNHDLLIGVSLILVGLGLIINPDSLLNLRALAYLAQNGSPTSWGLLFLISGLFNTLTVIWCVCPPFFIRLAARMVGAFAFLTLTFSNMLFSFFIPPTLIYLSISLWSVWGILRTKKYGR